MDFFYSLHSYVKYIYISLPWINLSKKLCFYVVIKSLAYSLIHFE